MRRIPSSKWIKRPVYVMEAVSQDPYYNAGFQKYCK